MRTHLALLAAASLAALPSTASRQDYVANGATTAYAFTFPAFSTAHVAVYLNGAKQSVGFTTALNANQTTSPGGTVTFTTAPAVAVAVRIQRETPRTQDTTYTPYSAFPAKTTERALDRVMAVAQELDRDKASHDDVNVAIASAAIGNVEAGGLTVSGNTLTQIAGDVATLKATAALPLPVVAARYNFDQVGAAIVEDGGTICHATFNADGSVTDTKGCAWTKNGTPAAVTSSNLYPVGFSSAARIGTGPLDDTNNWQLGTGVDALDPHVGIRCVVFQIDAIAPAQDQWIYGNADGARGHGLYLKVNTRQLFSYLPTQGSVAAGTNIPMGVPVLACIGHDGTNAWFMYGGEYPQTKTCATSTAPTLTPAYIGRRYSTGAGGNVKVWEFYATSTVPTADVLLDIQRRFYAHRGTNGERLSVARASEVSYVAKGPTWTAARNVLPINETGAYVTTEALRGAAGLGLGSSCGAGSLTYTPSYAWNAAGTDKIILSDMPKGGSLSGDRVNLRYVAASNLFRLTVNAVSVDSAVQSFAASTPIALKYLYYTDGRACLTVAGVQTCSGATIAPFTPNAFLNLGGDTTVGASGGIKDVAFQTSIGGVATAVAALGDSITEGTFGDAARVSYPKRLAASTAGRYTVDNHGVSGETVGQIGSRYKQHVKGMGYKAAVLMAGVNDIMTVGASGATTYAVWSALADEIRADGLRLVAFTVLPFKGAGAWTAGKQTELDALNASILAYCAARTDVICVDAYTDFEDPGNLDQMKAAYSHDWIHPNQAGNDRLAALLGAAFP